jgi:cell division protein FtsN
MAQNYNKKSNSSNKRRGQQRSNGFPVFVSGFILGILACQILPYLLKAEKPYSINNNDVNAADAPAKPDFQFPNLLKGGEINIPRTEPNKETNTNKVTDASYLLQVGSFKNKAEAESVRVNLLLLNLPAFIEPFKTSTGGKLHRVLVGPFNNSEESSSARKKLMENSLDSLLLKRNNS